MPTLRFADFASSFPPIMKEKIEKLAGDLEQAAIDKLNSVISEPVDTGRLKASRSIAKSKKGVRIGWSEVRAIPIDIGRIKSKTMTRKLKSGRKSKPYSRLLGSESAPEGLTKPAIEELRKSWEEVVKKAQKEFDK